MFIIAINTFYLASSFFQLSLVILTVLGDQCLTQIQITASKRGCAAGKEDSIKQFDLVVLLEYVSERVLIHPSEGIFMICITEIILVMK